MTIYSGFSKFDRAQRIKYVVENSMLSESESDRFNDYLATEEEQQQIYSAMIENYLGNFPLPLGVVTNMVVNDESLIVPFVTEESSVIAAASKAAKYWAHRGGFRANIVSMTKKGQVHFTWNGKPEKIKNLFSEIRGKLVNATSGMTENMRNRGGGITSISLIDKTMELPEYFQIDVSFETSEAMGANFINSCLEKMGSVLLNLDELNTDENHVEVIMSILSNYSPECRVNCWVECPVEMLTGWNKDLNHKVFAKKFKLAVDIANLDISRAVTHNKGIFNGVDAVLLATGNDIRATSAAAHAYASRNGHYRSLTSIDMTDTTFRYGLEIPLAVGTVGGITRIHPVVKNNLALMNYPDASKLMMIAAASGLANNFAAIASLITTGIQEGHMKMHLSNILNQLNVSASDRESVYSHFSGNTVSYSSVKNYITQIHSKI
jgi:hydroxymethylglutaryl-CoA reductase